MATIRIPRRVLFYMANTGWHINPEENLEPGDARFDLLHLEESGPNADGSATIKDPSPELLDRLVREAEYLRDGLRYGDPSPDNLADYNAGGAMIRRVEALR